MKFVYVENWEIAMELDDDQHLNIYIKNYTSTTVREIETGRGDGVQEQLALRFTTAEIEEEARENETT